MAGWFGVVVRGPLAEFAQGFAGRLVALGYAPRSAEGQLRLMRHLSVWLDGRGLSAGDLCSDLLERFIAVRRVTYSSFRSERALAPLLGYLRILGVAPPAAPPVPIAAEDVLLGRFACYLSVERALAPETVRSYVSQVRPFVAAHITDEGGWAVLTPTEVSAFVVERAVAGRSRSLQVRANALRALLRWMWQEKMTPTSLAGAVGRVAAPMIAVPKALNEVELEGLFESLSSEPAARLRDEAMVALMWRLGLRAGEVARLVLDDIDWAAGAVTVRGKRGRVEEVPLPVDVGERVVAYLRGARPAGGGHRQAFLAVDAPHGPLGRAAVTSVVSRSLRRAGIGGGGAAHRLRHTAARRVLSAGGGLVEAGQLLRHASVDTTAIYATLDQPTLAVLARPWPIGASR